MSQPKMNRIERAVLPSLVALVLVACGPDETPGLSLSFSSAALVDGTDRLATYFFGEDEGCTEIRSQLPRPQALHGPFLSDPITADDRARGITLERTDIPAGLYNILVDALSPTEAVIGSGCAEGQTVFDQGFSTTRIVIDEL